MKRVADTSVLMALLNEEDDRSDAAAGVLGEAYREGSIVINEAVYAELSAYFEEKEAVDGFLESVGIRVESLDREALHRAGRAFRDYLDNRPEGLQCPECGEVSDTSCPECGSVFGPRQHIPSDFLIGSHASTVGGILSFDRDFFSTYFPDMEIDSAGRQP